MRWDAIFDTHKQETVCYSVLDDVQASVIDTVHGTGHATLCRTRTSTDLRVEGMRGARARRASEFEV